MRDKKQNSYDDCTKMVHELIDAWEKMRPDEELVVMVLPKYDQTERKERIEQINRMLFNERW